MDVMGSTFSAAETQSSKVRNEAAIAVATKTYNIHREQGEAAVDLVDQIDRVAQELKNFHIDVEL